MTDFLPFWFFVIALVYSSVGFAGGSSYLLVLTMAGFAQTQSAPLALICNLAVSAVVSVQFYRAGHFRARLALPFAVLSVPMAFLGSKIHVQKEIFLALLAFSLSIAALRLFLQRPEASARPAAGPAWKAALPIGAGIGFLSGIVGIGGGIFLSPILVLKRWASPKEAGSSASFFIFVNSLSGLIGRIQTGIAFEGGWTLLLAAAFMGGLAGSKLGAERLSQVRLQKVLAVLLLYLSANMFWKVIA